MDSPGQRFRQAIEAERPLQVVGVINAYCARLAERAGFRSIYLSGAGVANAAFGLPDLGRVQLLSAGEITRRALAASSFALVLIVIATGLRLSSLRLPMR